MRTRSTLTTATTFAFATTLLVVCCRDFADSGADGDAGGAPAAIGGQPADGSTTGNGATSGDGSPPTGGAPLQGGDAAQDAAGAGGGGAPGAAGSHDASKEAGGAAGQGSEPQAGSDSGPLSPATLPGLALWLEGATGSFTTTGAARVSSWKDSAGHSNDATESDPARRPLLQPQSLNGHPTVLFDGGPSNLVISDAPSLQLGTAFTVALVAEWENSPDPTYTTSGDTEILDYFGYGTILGKTISAPPFSGFAVFANYPTAFSDQPAQRRFGAQLELGTAQQASGASNLNDGAFRLFVVQRLSAGVCEIRINGRPQGPFDIPPELDASAAGHSLLFGGQPWQDFRGALAEVVIVNHGLSETQLGGLEAYLMGKFGL